MKQPSDIPVDLDASFVCLDVKTTFNIASNTESLLGLHITACDERYHLQCPEWLDTISRTRGTAPLEEFVG